MPEFLRDYRAKYNAYDDLDDDQLLTALHGKYTSETGAELSLEQFRESVGYAPIDQPSLAAPPPLEEQQPEPSADITQASEPIRPDMIRNDGTQKGTGYFGVLKTPDGRDMTEYSVGIEMNGKETEIPTLVPTLTPEEINTLKNTGEVTREILNKAVDHARQRMSENKSPFWQEGEETYGAEPSMLDLVGDKLASLGGAVVSGAEGAIPQAKLQISGLLQAGEFITEDEFTKSGQALTKRDGTLQTYEEAKQDFEALNPFRTWVAKKGKELSQGVRAEAQPPKFEKGSPEYYTEAITGSVINMLPMLGVSIIGRRPDIGLGIMMAQSKGGAREQGRLEGLGTLEAETYSTLTSAAEIIPSILPLGVLMKPSGKYVIDLVKAGISEAAQETVTAALQAGIDKGYINEDMTWGEAVDRMIEGAIVGAGAGTAISAVTSPIAGKMAEKDRIKAVEGEIEASFDQSMAEMPTPEQEAIEALKPERGVFQEEAPEPTASEILAEQDQTGLPLAEDVPRTTIEEEPVEAKSAVEPEPVPELTKRPESIEQAAEQGFDTDTVFYHGTEADFEDFETGTAQGWGTGVYFSDNIEDVKEFGKNIKKAHLRGKNIYRGENISEDVMDASNAWKKVSDRYESAYDAFQEDGNFANDLIRELGYDGIAVEGSNNLVGTEFVIFDTKNIFPIKEEPVPAIEPEAKPEKKPEPLPEIKPTKAAPALTPMPKIIHSGPTTYKPKPINSDLFRESSIESLSDLLMNSLSNTIEKGSVTPVFVADNKDIALGQRKNRGIMIELDGSLVSGERVKKPGIIEGITGLEYKTDFIGRDAIKSFIVPKGKRISGAGRVMANRHFDVSKNDDGSVTYTRKDLVGEMPEPTPALEPEVKPEIKPTKAVELPLIVTQTKKKYLGIKAKEAGLKKGSPGYDAAYARIEEQYEDDVDFAQASLPFEQYNDLNKESPESINRIAYDSLREDLGISKKVPQKLEAKQQDTLFSVQVGKEKPTITTPTKKPAKLQQAKGDVYQAPGTNYVRMFRSMGIPERRAFASIEGRKINIPDKPQRIEPIMRKLVQVAGRRIYFGKIKGKSSEGFYRPHIGEIRTRRKNDVEVLAHELAHYLDMYSNETLPDFEKLYKKKEFVDQVKALSYTDAGMGLQEIEGFAEFVRLWLTNAQEAQRRAPGFYDAFGELLKSDKKLSKNMAEMQELMHKFYFQGPDKLGQALIGKENTFIEDFDLWKYRRDSRIRQQTIDRFHAARKIEQELTYKISGANESAWKQFRIANGGAEGIADYIMNYGTVNFDETGDLVKTGKSLHAVLEPVKSIKLNPEHKGDKKIDLLLRYFAGRRALELHGQGRENLIPKETAMIWAKLGGTYPVFETIHKDYQAFNKRMMNMFYDSGLVTGEGRRAMESMNKDYVPFNRIRETLTDGRKPGGGGFQRLKGGTSNLNDILVNIQDGIASNVRAALTNRAKQRLYQYISNNKDGAIFATHLSPDSKKVQVYLEEMEMKIGQVLEASGIEVEGEIDLSDPDLTSFWQHGVKPKVNESGNLVDTVIINGKPKYYEVQDPLLQDMLLAMNPESYSSFMNVMFGAKNFFTRLITLGIEFTGANLVRDTIGATFLSKNNFIPFLDSFKGMHSFITKDKHYKDFMRSGGGYSSRLHASTKEGVARRKVSVDEFGVTTIPEKILSTVDNIASAFEYGTRIGEFRLAKKAGKSDMDAGYASREISTDFSVLGANRFLTGYIRTIPFLNAMIQSQDRVFREAIVKRKYDGNPVGMAMKAFLGVTVPTLILYLLNKDDEEYQKIPDYEKRTNWHFPNADGTFTKIPRPYDIGFVYATMPELFFKYLEDDKGKEFAEGMIWTLTQMYGVDGTPAIMTGWWDLVRNKKWTGAPVVPQAMADVEATEQYSSNTSESFIRMGEALGVSPIKAEHMFKAYTGYLGGYLLWGTDKLLWDEEKFGEKPDSKTSDNVFLRRFLAPKVRPATAAMEKFFELKEQSDKVVATFKQTVDVRRAIKQKKGAGKFKDDRFFGLSGKEKAVLFALNDSMNELIKVMYGKEGIKTAELKIKHDKNLSGAEKREQLDNLWLRRNDAFMQYYTEADKALQKAKKEAEQEK